MAKGSTKPKPKHIEYVGKAILGSRSSSLCIRTIIVSIWTCNLCMPLFSAIKKSVVVFALKCLRLLYSIPFLLVGHLWTLIIFPKCDSKILNFIRSSRWFNSMGHIFELSFLPPILNSMGRIFLDFPTTLKYGTNVFEAFTWETSFFSSLIVPLVISFVLKLYSMYSFLLRLNLKPYDFNCCFHCSNLEFMPSLFSSTKKCHKQTKWNKAHPLLLIELSHLALLQKERGLGLSLHKGKLWLKNRMLPFHMS